MAAALPPNASTHGYFLAAAPFFASLFCFGFRFSFCGRIDPLAMARLSIAIATEIRQWPMGNRQ